jgi:hypothetical protein
MSDRSPERDDGGRPAPRGRGKDNPEGGAQITGRTSRGTQRQRRPYRPRRDRGRFKLTPRDEWGMRWLGPGAELVEPKAWRAQMKEELQQMVWIYDTAERGERW